MHPVGQASCLSRLPLLTRGDLMQHRFGRDRDLDLESAANEVAKGALDFVHRDRFSSASTLARRPQEEFT